MGASCKGLSATILVLLSAVLLTLPAGAQAKTAGCHSSVSILRASGESAPASLSGTVEASVLAQYGVLRRAAQPSDTLPAINPAAGDIEFSLSGYFEGAIRQVLARPNGERVFIVPGLPRSLDLPPLRCVPKEVRKSLSKLEEREAKRATEPAFCVVDVGAPRTFGSEPCETFSEIPSSRRLFRLPISAEPVILLVPDGVASVRITGPGAATQTIAASENAYLYEMSPSIVKRRARLFARLFRQHLKRHPSAAERERSNRLERSVIGGLSRTEPTKVEWLDPSGVVLKTVTKPKTRGLLSLVII